MNHRDCDELMRKWVRAATDGDRLEHEDEVMWGVTFDLDSMDAPDALFATEDMARGYAALCARSEWHVGPYVCHLVTRNDRGLPKVLP